MRYRALELRRYLVYAPGRFAPAAWPDGCRTFKAKSRDDLGTVLRNEVQRQWQPAQHEFRVSRRSRLTSSGARWRPANVF